MNRLADLVSFYALIDLLSDRLGGRMRFSDLKGRSWPGRGVYFFFDDNEQRRDSGEGPRIVRVGTHALKAGSRSTLRGRLSQHRGDRSGGGNHRGSIFRLLVGQALLTRGEATICPSWGVKSDPGKASDVMNVEKSSLLSAERPVEQAVSNYLSRLTFMRLGVEDEPGPGSLRGLIERNAIALLSNFGRPALDPPSINWLGLSSDRPLVARSGLWNQRHITEAHSPDFLRVLAGLVELETRT